MIPHPEFMSAWDKDIALIRLSQPATWGAKSADSDREFSVQPIKLTRGRFGRDRLGDNIGLGILLGRQIA